MPSDFLGNGVKSYLNRSYAVESVTSTAVEYGLRLFHPTLDKAF
jgi:hypothetical protein